MGPYHTVYLNGRETDAVGDDGRARDLHRCNRYPVATLWAVTRRNSRRLLMSWICGQSRAGHGMRTTETRRHAHLGA